MRHFQSRSVRAGGEKLDIKPYRWWTLLLSLLLHQYRRCSARVLHAFYKTDQTAQVIPEGYIAMWYCRFVIYCTNSLYVSCDNSSIAITERQSISTHDKELAFSCRILEANNYNENNALMALLVSQ